MADKRSRAARRLRPAGRKRHGRAGHAAHRRQAPLAGDRSAPTARSPATAHAGSIHKVGAALAGRAVVQRLDLLACRGGREAAADRYTPAKALGRPWLRCHCSRPNERHPEFRRRDPCRGAGHAHALRHPQGASPDRRPAAADAPARQRRRARRGEARRRRRQGPRPGRRRRSTAATSTIAHQAEQKGTGACRPAGGGCAGRLRRRGPDPLRRHALRRAGDAAADARPPRRRRRSGRRRARPRTPADPLNYGRIILGEGDHIAKMVEYQGRHRGRARRPPVQ